MADLIFGQMWGATVVAFSMKFETHKIELRCSIEHTAAPIEQHTLEMLGVRSFRFEDHQTNLSEPWRYIELTSIKCVRGTTGLKIAMEWWLSNIDIDCETLRIDGMDWNPTAGIF